MIALKNRKGASALEFALVLPLLLVILFGIIEFGLLMYNKQVLTNASREGARAGIVSATVRPTLSDISGVTNTYCLNHLVTFATGVTPTTHLLITPITVPPLVDDSKICTKFGDDLAVQVTYVYTFLVFSNVIQLLPGSFPGTITLTAQTVMRCE